jgi:hypothetical protein
MQLLHIGDTLVQRTFDPWVGVFALAVFSAIAAAVWIPRAARKRTALRLGSWVVAAAVGLAVLPTVLPYDHLLLSEVAHSDVHKDHCHDAPGSCADAPISAGAGQFMSTEPLLAEPALTAVLLVFTIAAIAGMTFRPTLRPPQVMTTA